MSRIWIAAKQRTPLIPLSPMDGKLIINLFFISAPES